MKSMTDVVKVERTNVSGCPQLDAMGSVDRWMDDLGHRRRLDGFSCECCLSKFIK